MKIKMKTKQLANQNERKTWKQDQDVRQRTIRCTTQTVLKEKFWARTRFWLYIMFEYLETIQKISTIFKFHSYYYTSLGPYVKAFNPSYLQL